MIQINIHKKIHTPLGSEILKIDTAIDANKITAIYGRSGAGKTTLLRMLSGLIRPDKGQITAHGKTWFSSEENINLRVQKRGIGFVFQDAALFPNMNVRNNISFALRDKKNSLLVDQLLEETALSSLASRYPAQISGGQKQRVALARALAFEPELLLLDEPLSALDIDSRITLRSLIKKVHHKYRMTTVLVSHDIPELFSLADKIIKIEGNQAIACGSPKEAFDHALLRKQYGALLDL